MHIASLTEFFSRGVLVYIAHFFFKYLGHYDASALSKGGNSKQGGYFRFVNVMSELDEPVSTVYILIRRVVHLCLKKNHCTNSDQKQKSINA